MALVPKIKDGDWVSVRQAITKLAGPKLGPTSTPTFADLTLTNLTASRLVYTDANKQLESVADLTSWVAGAANEIDITDDGDGTITVGIINPLIVAKGGTGTATLTDGGILLGSGTGAITALGVATNGQIPIGDGTGDPVLATISGTANEIDVTNGAGTITIGIVNPLIVSKGGTGAATLTDGGIILGSGTGAVTVLAQATNGQIPIGSTGADPVLAGLTGTSNQITVTNAAGSITLSLPQDYDTSATPTLGGLTIVNAITEFSTDDTLGGNSDSALPTEQAVKAYVDNAVAGSSLYAFKTITGITNDVVADATNDTLTLASANSKLTVVGTAATDTVTFTVVEGQIVHDNLSGFVAGEHLSLPNTIANVLSDHNLAAHTALGLFDTSSDVDHDATTNFAANEHFLQTEIGYVSTALATGLLKVTTGTGALSVITDSSSNWDLAYTHIGESGASHTYIDQNVTTTGTPSFSTINSLTLAAAAVGFTIAGGTTSKTLTVDDNFVVSTQLTAIATNTAKVTESTTVTAPLVLTTYDISIPVATTSANGYLSSTDWNTFNSKQAGDAGLTSLAGLTYASDSFIKVTATDTYAIRTIAETKTDLSLNLVENTALSTWVGTTNITTLGTITTVGDITIANGGTIGQAAGPLLTFDDTNNYLEISGCYVGIGTDTPTETLHVKDGTNVIVMESTTGNPTFRLSDWGGAYWDIEVTDNVGDLDFIHNTRGRIQRFRDDGNMVNTNSFQCEADDETVLLIHSDTTSGSTTFYDFSHSSQTLTANGNVNHNTSYQKFGTTSIYFDGTGDFIGIADDSGLEFAGGNFTIDFWIYPTNESRRAVYAGNSDYWFGIDFHNQGTRNINIWASSNGTSWDLIHADAGGSGIGSISLTLNAWNHVAVVRSGDNWMSFINGVKDIDISVAGTITDKSEDKNIGRWGGDVISKFIGYIDEFRICKGVARWTANFTPPTRPYSTINDEFFNEQNDFFTSLGVQTYTPSNVSTDRSFDADATSTAELADVLGTLITDLQSIGILS